MIPLDTAAWPLFVTRRFHSACALFYTPARQAHHRTQPLSGPNHHFGATAWHRYLVGGGAERWLPLNVPNPA